MARIRRSPWNNSTHIDIFKNIDKNTTIEDIIDRSVSAGNITPSQASQHKAKIGSKLPTQQRIDDIYKNIDKNTTVSQFVDSFIGIDGISQRELNHAKPLANTYAEVYGNQVNVQKSIEDIYKNIDKNTTVKDFIDSFHGIDGMSRTELNKYIEKTGVKLSDQQRIEDIYKSIDKNTTVESFINSFVGIEGNTQNELQDIIDNVGPSRKRRKSNKSDTERVAAIERAKNRNAALNENINNLNELLGYGHDMPIDDYRNKVSRGLNAEELEELDLYRQYYMEKNGGPGPYYHNSGDIYDPVPGKVKLVEAKLNKKHQQQNIDDVYNLIHHGHDMTIDEFRNNIIFGLSEEDRIESQLYKEHYSENSVLDEIAQEKQEIAEREAKAAREAERIEAENLRRQIDESGSKNAKLQQLSSKKDINDQVDYIRSTYKRYNPSNSKYLGNISDPYVKYPDYPPSEQSIETINKNIETRPNQAKQELNDKIDSGVLIGQEKRRKRRKREQQRVDVNAQKNARQNLNNWINQGVNNWKTRKKEEKIEKRRRQRKERNEEQKAKQDLDDWIHQGSVNTKERIVQDKVKKELDDKIKEGVEQKSAIQKLNNKINEGTTRRKKEIDKERRKEELIKEHRERITEVQKNGRVLEERAKAKKELDDKIKQGSVKRKDELEKEEINKAKKELDDKINEGTRKRKKEIEEEKRGPYRTMDGDIWDQTESKEALRLAEEEGLSRPEKKEKEKIDKYLRERDQRYKDEIEKARQEYESIKEQRKNEPDKKKKRELKEKENKAKSVLKKKQREYNVKDEEWMLKKDMASLEAENNEMTATMGKEITEKFEWSDNLDQIDKHYGSKEEELIKQKESLISEGKDTKAIDDQIDALKKKKDKTIEKRTKNVSRRKDNIVSSYGAQIEANTEMYNALEHFYNQKYPLNSLSKMDPGKFLKTSGVNLASSIFFGVGTYKDARREGHGAVSSFARAGIDFALSETLGFLPYLGISLAKEIPSLAVKGANALFTESRKMNSASQFNIFGTADFNDTEQLATMRQSGMELAKMSQYRLEQTLMGNEAKYLHR